MKNDDYVYLFLRDVTWDVLRLQACSLNRREHEIRIFDKRGRDLSPMGALSLLMKSHFLTSLAHVRRDFDKFLFSTHGHSVGQSEA